VDFNMNVKARCVNRDGHVSLNLTTLEAGKRGKGGKRGRKKGKKREEGRVC
jgi:hypothetical protein